MQLTMLIETVSTVLGELMIFSLWILLCLSNELLLVYSSIPFM